MALHAKAKAEAGYRFYALYDKISREDILAHAYAQCRSNKGAPGVDGQDFADVDAYGVERWLGELAFALREETYRPDPIRRVFIPKANGKLRPLGISTLRDRVCMTAAMLVLEPIFEADLPEEQYAYRPGRNAQQAVVEVEELRFKGHPEVVDADLADYFGSIPHAELLKSVARRIVDRRVLHLIKMWLECPVEETDDRGRKTRTTEAKDTRRGIPQGSPLTPLTQKVTLVARSAVRAARPRRTPVIRPRSRRHGNAVSNDDGVIAHENFLDHQAHDTLAFGNIKRIGGVA
jgi:group II intron reverse transcriptase/maturase